MDTESALFGDATASTEESKYASARRWLTRAAIVVGLAGGAALMVWHDGAESRAIRALPEVERHALYARTLQTLATVCASSAEGGLHDYCAREAQLALAFPECDQTCEQLAGKRISRIPQQK